MGKSKNPFQITFGKAPEKYISRIKETHEILDDFQSDAPGSMVYMISGVRGSGKTVLLTEISKELMEEKEWIVISLNPEKDMLQMLVAALSEQPALKKTKLKAGINLNAPGIGVSVEQIPFAVDYEVVVEGLLQQLFKQKKKLLVTIDEVTNNPNVRVFASAFQNLIRKDLPIYLLMTGLYENIHDLQNEKSQTFLYRAPKVMLEPLRLSAVQMVYRDVFHIDEEAAREFAHITQGYSFAFQVLGYLLWKDVGASIKKDPKGALQNVLPQLDAYLEDYVYEKIWQELSKTDKKIVRTIIRENTSEITDIRQALKVTPQMFYEYKKRLINKGILFSPAHGRIEIQLPRFAEYVNHAIS